MADKNHSTFIGGVAIGVAIGAVTGLLLAPRKGQDTRKIVNKTVTALPQMAEDISSSLQLQADKLSTATGDRWHDTLDRLATSIAAGIAASQSMRAPDSATESKSAPRVDE